MVYGVAFVGISAFSAVAVWLGARAKLAAAPFWRADRVDDGQGQWLNPAAMALRGPIEDLAEGSD